MQRSDQSMNQTTRLHRLTNLESPTLMVIFSFQFHFEVLRVDGDNNRSLLRILYLSSYWANNEESVFEIFKTIYFK